MKNTLNPEDQWRLNAGQSCSLCSRVAVKTGATCSHRGSLWERPVLFGQGDHGSPAAASRIDVDDDSAVWHHADVPLVGAEHADNIQGGGSVSGEAWVITFRRCIAGVFAGSDGSAGFALVAIDVLGRDPRTVGIVRGIGRSPRA